MSLDYRDLFVRDEVRDVRTFHKFHDQEWHTISLEKIAVIHAHHSGMLRQICQRPIFLLHSLKSRTAVGGDNLQRSRDVSESINHLVNASEPAFPQRTF